MRGMLYFCLICGTVKTWFSAFSDSLFAENHSLVLINLSLTVLNNALMLLCSRRKSVLYTDIIGTSTFEGLGRSFTCKKNNNGPSAEPCSPYKFATTVEPV